MALKQLTPMLWTEKLDETVDFYTKTLGFTCLNKRDDWGWASLRNGDVHIMLARPEEHFPFTEATFTGSFYIFTDNVEELWDQLKGTVKVCYELETFEWGMKEFGIYDNNGYLLQFGQGVAEESAAEEQTSP